MRERGWNIGEAKDEPIYTFTHPCGTQSCSGCIYVYIPEVNLSLRRGRSAACKGAISTVVRERELARREASIYPSRARALDFRAGALQGVVSAAAVAPLLHRLSLSLYIVLYAFWAKGRVILSAVATFMGALAFYSMVREGGLCFLKGCVANCLLLSIAFLLLLRREECL